MKQEGFSTSFPGRLVDIGENDFAFLPDPLPPKGLSLEPVMTEFGEAMQAIGYLQGRGKSLPNPHLLIQPLRQSEALASSRIEGTFAEPQDLAVAAAKAQPEKAGSMNDNTREVLNYKLALDNAMNALSEMPISNSMIRGIHGQLLSGLSATRGAEKNPGEYRERQCHIEYEKTIRFTPPPALQAEAAMNDLATYIRQSNSTIPPLIDAALVHYQFETIHPFADGNGRVGRILIPIFLATRGVLGKDLPLFSLSIAIEKRKQEYINGLLEVSRKGDWIGWIRFFLKIAQETCEETFKLEKKIFSLLEEYKGRLAGKGQTKLLVNLVEYLFQQPAVSIPHVAEACEVTYPTAQRIVERLVQAGILWENPNSRPRMFLARDIINLTS